MDDLALIRRILEGDRHAYRILVVRYQRPVFRFLRTFSSSGPAGGSSGSRLTDAIIEEIAQEAFLRAYKSLASYDPTRGASFSTWLFTIAKNLALNEAAKASTKREVCDDRGNQRGGGVRDARDPDERGSGAGNVGSVGPVASSPYDDVERAERGSMLHRALHALPQVFRSAVVLAYLKELSLDEIAAIERCSVGTVKSRIFRGKRLLAAALAKTEG